MEQRRFHDALDYQRQAKHHAERRDYSREAKEPTGTSLAGLGDPYRPQPQRQSHSVAPPAIAPYGIGNRILPDRHERHPVGGGVEAGYGIGNRAVPNRQAPKGRRQGDMAGGGDYPYFGGESHPRIPRGPATPYRPPQPRHRQEVRHDYGPPMAAPREMAPPPQVVHRQGYGAMTYPQSDPVRHVVRGDRPLEAMQHVAAPTGGNMLQTLNGLYEQIRVQRDRRMQDRWNASVVAEKHAFEQMV